MILRPATWGDEARLLEWKNDPDVRAYASIQTEIHPAEHHAWLGKMLSGAAYATLYIAEVDGVPVGQGRIERTMRTLSPKTDSCVIGYSIAKEHRGKKYGKQLVHQLVIQAKETYGYPHVGCRIKRGNMCSVYVAMAAGVNGIEFF